MSSNFMYVRRKCVSNRQATGTESHPHIQFFPRATLDKSPASSEEKQTGNMIEHVSSISGP